MLLQNLLRSQQNHASLIVKRRSMSSSTTSRFNHPPDNSDHSSILEERTLLTQLSPLKRIVCLCPVPLGRGRVSWSGGDELATPTPTSQTYHPANQTTINLDFQSQYSSKRNSSNTNNNKMMMMMMHEQQLASPSPKVTKYRYGERFAIGVAVSDPYLTHAIPVHLSSNNGSSRGGGANNATGNSSDGSGNGYIAEIVPTFKGDMHNLGTSSPIFYTNLPYFRRDFLQKIGHTDIGAIVLALPMLESEKRNHSNNAFGIMPTKLQLEEERKSEEVRGYLFGLLQNYVSVDSSSSMDEDDDTDGSIALMDGKNNKSNQRRDGVPFFGPLNVQGRINRRLSIADVLSKATGNGNWDHLARGIRSCQGSSSISSNNPSMTRCSRNFGQDDVTYCGPAVSVSPEIHAAVALNAMLETHTSNFHNSFF